MNSGSCLTHGMCLDQEKQKHGSSRSVARPSTNTKTAERKLARRRARAASKARDQNRVQNFLHDIHLSLRQMFMRASDSHRLDSKKKFTVLKSDSSSRSYSFHNARATTLSGLSMCR